jgi:hypothetical protein
MYVMTQSNIVHFPGLWGESIISYRGEILLPDKIDYVTGSIEPELNGLVLVILSNAYCKVVPERTRIVVYNEHVQAVYPLE